MMKRRGIGREKKDQRKRGRRSEYGVGRRNRGDKNGDKGVRKREGTEAKGKRGK